MDERPIDGQALARQNVDSIQAGTGGVVRRAQGQPTRTGRAEKSTMDSREMIDVERMVGLGASMAAPAARMPSTAAVALAILQVVAILAVPAIMAVVATVRTVTAAGMVGMVSKAAVATAALAVATDMDSHQAGMGGTAAGAAPLLGTAVGAIRLEDRAGLAAEAGRSALFQGIARNTGWTVCSSGCRN